jgi:hypothetical protein
MSGNSCSLVMIALAISAGACRRSRRFWRSSRIRRTREPLSMAGRGRCGREGARARLHRRHSRWNSGGFGATTSTPPTLAGRPMSRSRPCSRTTTPSTIATRPAAFRGRGRPCSRGWFTVVNVATRWSCSTRGGPATCVTTSVSNTACPSASISPLIRWTPRWLGPSLPRSPRSNLMLTSVPLGRSSRRRQRATGPARSSSSACATRQHWPNGSASVTAHLGANLTS